MKVQVVVVLTLILTMAWVWAAWAAEEGAAGFSDRERVAAYLDSNPFEAVEQLEAVLTPEQIEQLEVRMFPAPSAGEELDELEAIRTRLKRLGYREADAVVSAIDTRIQALATSVK